MGSKKLCTTPTMVVVGRHVPPSSSWIVVVVVVVVVCISAAAWKCSFALTFPTPPPPPSSSSRRGFLAKSQVVAAVPLLLLLPSKDDAARAIEKNRNNNNDETPSRLPPPPPPPPPPPRTIVVPIEYVPDLSAYICRFRLGNNNNGDGNHYNDFCGIIDTGSPFLTVPSYCDTTTSNTTVWDGGPQWGCYNAIRDDGSQTFATPTYERFDNNAGRVDWRTTNRFAFLNVTTEVVVVGGDDGGGGGVGAASSAAFGGHDYHRRQRHWQQQQQQQQQGLVFGVLASSLMGGSGGVFLGLIRDTDPKLRPSFLGQLGIRSFTIDFGNNILTLSDQPLPLVLSASSSFSTSSSSSLATTTEFSSSSGQDPLYRHHSHDYIPLVTDLRRYGDPALHYTAQAASVMVNGRPLVSAGDDGGAYQNIYVIFDTGVTGMVVDLQLWEDRYKVARANKERSLWGEVAITFATKTIVRSRQTATATTTKDHPATTMITLTASKPLTTPLGQSLPWKGFKGQLIVIGLAFLDHKKLSIDIDNRLLLLE